MSKRIFTQEQINELLKNNYVTSCREKSISYHKDFKLFAVKQYESGLPAREIFTQAGFDERVIGSKTPRRCLQRWMKVFRTKGVNHLSLETRGRGGGRPKTHWASDREKLKYLEAQVAYLRAENAFLAKLRKKRLN
jgi:hypothetical protein